MTDEQTSIVQTILDAGKSTEELTAHIATLGLAELAEARTAFAALAEVEDIDDDAVAELESLSTAVAERISELEKAAMSRKERLAAVKSTLGVTEEPEAVEEEVKEEEAAETVETEQAETVEEPVPAPVVASGHLKKIAARQPADTKPADPEPQLALVASAGGYEGDRIVDRKQLGEIALKKWQGMGSTRPSSRQFYSIAQMQVEHKYTMTADPDHNASVLSMVAMDAQSEGNLAASGGICAPSQPVYELYNIATSAGLLNLPTVNAPRGRITIPTSPSLADFLGASGIATEWTNANDIDPSDPATKPAYTFECPETTTCTVAAWPTILEFGNFVQRFYPEAVANAMSLAMVASDRTVNAARIAFLEANDDPFPAFDTGSGGLTSLAYNLAAQGADYRENFGMDPEAPLDLVLPSWVVYAIWTDALLRDSTTAYDEVKRRIAGVFADLNYRAQFVYDFEDAISTGFNPTASAFIMAPGTVVELDGGTLDLGIVRDSTLNATNDFQTFAEPFVGWCKPGHQIRKIVDIDVCPSGATGDRVTVACQESSS